MEITLNNNKETFEQSELSIQQIMNIKNYTFKMLVVKLNGKVIEKSNFDSTIVKDGDNLIILHLISGG